MLKFSASLHLALYRAFDDEDAQGLTEYALIIALVVLVAVAALRFLSKGITTELTSAATSL